MAMLKDASSGIWNGQEGLADRLGKATQHSNNQGFQDPGTNRHSGLREPDYQS